MVAAQRQGGGVGPARAAPSLPFAELVANDQWILPEYADVRQFLQIPVALWRARGLAEQSLAPPLSARQTSVSAGSARKNSAISSMSGHSNGSLPAVRTSVMVSNHL